MTRHTMIILAALGSLGVLMGAYGFQYLGEMAPCKLCYWQRYPHMAAVVIGLFALMVPGRALPRLGALAAFTSAAIGFITLAWKKPGGKGQAPAPPAPLAG